MEFLILVLVTFIFFVYGVIVGWNAREKHALKLTKQLLDGIEEKVQEETKDKIYVTIEKHNDIIYVYDKINSTFMAQGKSKEEIEDVLSKRYPGKRFAASEEELAKAGFIS